MVNNVTEEPLRKAVAIVIERVVILSEPKVAKMPHNVINFILIVIGDSNWEALFEGQTCTVASLNNDDTGAIIVMSAIREFVLVELNGCVVEPKTEKF